MGTFARHAQFSAMGTFARHAQFSAMGTFARHAQFSAMGTFARLSFDIGTEFHNLYAASLLLIRGTKRVVISSLRSAVVDC